MNRLYKVIPFCGIAVLSQISFLQAQDDTLVLSDETPSVAPLVTTGQKPPDPVPREAPAADKPFQTEVKFRNGTLIRGTVVHHTDSSLTVSTDGMGTVVISRSSVESLYESRTGAILPCDTVVVAEPAECRYKVDKAGYCLMFMPTAFMQERSTLYFKSRELLFMNLDFAPSSRISFTAGALFPVSFNFQALTLGTKIQMLSRATKNGTVACAISGTAAVPLFFDSPWWAATGVVSYRTLSQKIGIHGAVGIQSTNTSEVQYTYADEVTPDWMRSLVYAAGIEGQTGPNSKFIVELFNYAPFQETSEASFLSFGMRMFGERLSTDLGTLIPVSLDMSGFFLLLPYVSVAIKIR